MKEYEGDPDVFVTENEDTLVRLLKHGDDKFVRALVLSALVEHGDEPQLEDVERDIQRAKRGAAD